MGGEAEECLLRREEENVLFQRPSKITVQEEGSIHQAKVSACAQRISEFPIRTSNPGKSTFKRKQAGWKGMGWGWMSLLRSIVPRSRSMHLYKGPFIPLRNTVWNSNLWEGPCQVLYSQSEGCSSCPQHLANWLWIQERKSSSPTDYQSWLPIHHYSDSTIPKACLLCF